MRKLARPHVWRLLPRGNCDGTCNRAMHSPMASKKESPWSLGAKWVLPLPPTAAANASRDQRF
eukprot:3568729-Heterocapsa_arctica.AAC.1